MYVCMYVYIYTAFISDLGLLLQTSNEFLNILVTLLIFFSYLFDIHLNQVASVHVIHISDLIPNFVYNHTLECQGRR